VKHTNKNLNDARTAWFGSGNNSRKYYLLIKEESTMNETSENPIRTAIRIPEAYVPLMEDIRLLTTDQNNPNRTTIKQQEQIWRSLQKYGWTYPIIVNNEGVFCDGEQRAEVCKQHGEFYAPVLRLPVSDVDRRMLRQILNKLKGKHNKDLDAAEFVRIAELGEKEDLKMLLASVGERLPDDFDGKRESIAIPQTWELIVECKDESEQQRFYEKLKTEGYKLRILTL
jgi:ParB-like chromosome segregation protein Spo0J